MSIHVIECQEKNIPLFVPMQEGRFDLSPNHLSSIAGELAQWHSSKLPESIVQLLREVADVHTDIIDPVFSTLTAGDLLKSIREGYAFGRCCVSDVKNRSYEKSIMLTLLHSGKTTVLIFNI